MRIPADLHEHILSLINCLGKENVGSVLKVLCEKTAINRNALLTVVPLPEQRLLLGKLYDCWQLHFPDLSGDRLAIAIESAYLTRGSLLSEKRESLVWTGPDISGYPVRRTDQALQEVIQSAQASLLIVTFAAYKVPVIIDALNKALARGVIVRFVAETADEGDKILFSAIDALGTALVLACEVYYWPRDKREESSSGKYGSLHAKVAVADSSMMLLSSANLTDYALSLNIEMGVLIKGGHLPKRAVATFEELIEKGILVRR